MLKDNIKVDLIETVRLGVKWIHLAQDAVQRRDLVNMVMKLRVHKIREIC